MPLLVRKLTATSYGRYLHYLVINTVTAEHIGQYEHQYEIKVSDCLRFDLWITCHSS